MLSGDDKKGEQPVIYLIQLKVTATVDGLDIRCSYREFTIAYKYQVHPKT